MREVAIKILPENQWDFFSSINWVRVQVARHSHERFDYYEAGSGFVPGRAAISTEWMIEKMPCVSQENWISYFCTWRTIMMHLSTIRLAIWTFHVCQLSPVRSYKNNKLQINHLSLQLKLILIQNHDRANLKTANREICVANHMRPVDMWATHLLKSRKQKAGNKSNRQNHELTPQANQQHNIQTALTAIFTSRPLQPSLVLLLLRLSACLYISSLAALCEGLCDSCHELLLKGEAEASRRYNLKGDLCSIRWSCAYTWYWSLHTSWTDGMMASVTAVLVIGTDRCPRSGWQVVSRRTRHNLLLGCHTWSNR